MGGRWCWSSVDGDYSANNTSFDVTQTVVFGLLGFVFVTLRCEPAPLILGFVLGPMMEENLRRALLRCADKIAMRW